MIKKIIQAITNINSNAKFRIFGSDIDTCTIIWEEGTTEISKKDIKAEMDNL